MTIEVLISFVDRDSLTGKLTSYAQGDVVYNLSDEVANAFINEGLAKAYTALGVSGNISITANGQYSVADYAGATVNVPDFKNLVDRSITSVTADMLAGITKIGGFAFGGCQSLTSVEIPNSVTSIEFGAFTMCGLQSITIPSSVTLIDAQAFQMCESLESVTVLATTPPTLSEQSVFDGTSQNLVIHVPAESVDTYKAASGWSDYESKIQAIPAEEAQS